MKRSILAVAALALLSSQSYALTLQQAYDQVSGPAGVYHCAGSTCTQKNAGPDVTFTQPAVAGWNAPAVDRDGQHCTIFGHAIFWAPGFKDRLCTPNAVTEDMNHPNAAPAQSSTSPTCLTTSKTLDHTGPDFNTGWSVTASTSSSVGRC